MAGPDRVGAAGTAAGQAAETRPAAHETQVYVGLGSNLDDPKSQVLRAIEALAGLPGTRLLARSPLYATAPVGPVDQPDYVNAAARLATRLAPRELLRALQAIERSQGRVRNGTRWGPRTLDLDILVYGDLALREPGLALPHPEIPRRAFVLVPLADIAPPDLKVPGQGRLDDLLAACPQAHGEDRGGGAPIRPIPDGEPDARAPDRSPATPAVGNAGTSRQSARPI